MLLAAVPSNRREVDPVTASTTRPLVCVVVLNYNGLAHLKYCLPSILATEYVPLRVVVVDNASTDGSGEYVSSRFAAINLIHSESNRGWSGGNNLGIQYGIAHGAKYIVLANNDIRVDPRWVSEAVLAAEQDDRIGIVGFRVIEPHGDDMDAGFMRAKQEWTPAKPRDAKLVDGMAMCVRASLFEAIGLIDEGFFAYAEDNDFERRARRAGYRVVATNVPVWHRGQGSFGKIPLRAAALQVRNNLRLALKHDSPAGALYQLLRHFAKGCLPFVKTDMQDPVARRLRASNIVVNFGILVYAVGWNIWNLPGTIRRRRVDDRNIQKARRQWGCK